MDAREAVALWITGDRKSVQQAYIAVRTLNPQSKTVAQCEKQLVRWHREMQGSEPVSEDPEATEEDQLCAAVTDRMQLFDDTTLVLLKVLSCIGVDPVTGSGSPGDIAEAAENMMQGLLSMVRFGVNPKTAILEVVQELRAVCIDSNGVLATDIDSKIPEACHNALSALEKSNLVRDLTRLL